MRIAPRIATLGCLVSLMMLSIPNGRAETNSLPVTIGNYTLVRTTPVSRTTSDYTYKAKALNRGTVDLLGVTAKLTSLSSKIVVIDGSLAFGTIAAGQTVTSSDTFTVRRNRTIPFNPADLRWRVSGKPKPGTPVPVANAGPDQTVQLGQTVHLDGSASSAGKSAASDSASDHNDTRLTYKWSFMSKPAGSTAVLSSATAVKPTFVVDKAGTYVVQLIVNNGRTNSAPDTVNISTEDGENPPVANAGPDQTVFVTDSVTLDGSSSSDADGDPLTYSWSFVSRPAGSTATLSSATAVRPTFVVDTSGTYVVRLLVNDGTADSAPDTVSISTQNSPPVANAGPDQTVTTNATVTLDGSASNDVDGNALAYSWSFVSRPAGSTAALSNSTAAQPTFVVDIPGTYVVRLLVNDGTTDSAPDTVSISTQNSPPVANAGPDQSAFVTSTVTLDGGGSSDVDGDTLTYSWSLTSRPTNSNAVLSSTTAVAPTFVVDLPGTYVAQLIVNDGTVDSAPDTMTVTTRNSSPVANAGPDQTVVANTTATLNGGGSTDVDGDTLTYSWSLTSTPAGSTAVLSSPTAVQPTFVADQAGTYIAQLIVNDGLVNSAPDTVVITTTPLGNTPPTANAGPDQTVPLGATVQLDGSTSADADGNPLTYTWSFTSTPAGSTPTLSNVSAVNPTFVADAPGMYVLQLIVNDGQVNSAPDTVTITTANSTPVANAGVDQTVQPGDTVQLDGTGSSDADGDTLTYSWSFSALPEGATIPPLLPSDTAANPTFVANTAGLYVAQLIVNDSKVNSPPDTATITVNAGPSMTLTPNPLNLLTSATGTLTVTLSSPAGANGVVVTLASNNSAVASVPTSVTIAQNQTSTTAQVTAGTTSGSATITATAPSFTNGTTTVNVGTRTMTLTPASSLIGVGNTASATLLLAQPAPAGGITVNLSSSSTGTATISPASVVIAQGATAPTTPITITGVAAGSVTLSATATGVTQADANVTITTSLINLGAGLVVAPGQTQGLALSLTAPAPQGGVTIALASSDTALATVAASVFIPQGQTIPTANPQVTGVAPGTVQITASDASGNFAPATRSVQVALTLSFTPTTLTVAQNSTATITLNLSAPAPQPNGLTVNLSTDDTNRATVPATVIVAAGATSMQITVTARNTTGNTTLQASGSGTTTTTAQITVTLAPPITLNDLTIGKDLAMSSFVSLGAAAPAGNLQVTITSADQTRVLLATSATAPGSASITMQANAGSTNTSTFYVHALAASGTVQLTATAPGYANGTAVITLGPAGFIISSPGDFSVPSGQDTNLQVVSGLLDSTTLNFIQSQQVRGGITVQVPISSSNPTVGTIVGSPVPFLGGESVKNAVFRPLTGGTSVLSVEPPAGFSTPSERRQITATVTTAQINLFSYSQSYIDGINMHVGRDLQEQVSLSLESTPPSPVTVTVTSNEPSIVTVSANGTVAGGATITFPNVTTTTVGQFFVQGLTIGSTTLTVSAPGYGSRTVNVIVDPAGFVFASGDFTTNAFAGDTQLTIYTVPLDPTTLSLYPQWPNIVQNVSVRGGLTVQVPISSGDTTVGTIVGSPVTFQGGGLYYNTTAAFRPLASGTSVLTVETPAGFSTPSERRQITATVNTAQINILSYSQSYIDGINMHVGYNLQELVYLSLESAPPSPLTVTVTSNGPTIATVSADGTVEGGSSVTFPNVTTTTIGQIFVQGLTLGSSTTLTVSAPGYGSRTVNVIVDPAGFVFASGDFTTNAFAGDTALQIYSALLEPTTLNVRPFYTFQSMSVRGGLTVQVPLSSGDTTVGTILGSPVTFQGGDPYYNTTAAFRPLTSGTSVLSVETPAGFSTPSNSRQITATVNTAQINLFSYSQSYIDGINMHVGQNLQELVYLSLESPPPSPIAVTVTSSGPSIVAVSTDGTVAGGSSVTFPNVTTTTIGQVFVQGLTLGSSTTLTVSAPGYGSRTVNVIVDPAGFVFASGDFTTNAFAGDTALQIYSALLEPTTLNVHPRWPYVFQSMSVRGGLTVQVPLSSGDTTVGTILGSPVTFQGGDPYYNTTAAFRPLTSGTSVLSVETPAGFSTPSNSRQITATVNTAQIFVQSASLSNIDGINMHVGQNLQEQVYLYLESTPPSPIAVTVSSSGPSIVAVSTDGTVAGGSSVTFPNVTTTTIGQVFVQGLTLGSSTTLTVSAPGYASRTVNVIVDPAGFVFTSGDFTTNVSAADTPLFITSALLDPTTLNVRFLGVAWGLSVRGGLTVQIPVSSSSTAVGTIIGSPVTFAGGEYVGTDAAFRPLANGTSVLSVETPVGFSTPSNRRQLTATVSP